jgi:hypothetical protein
MKGEQAWPGRWARKVFWPFLHPAGVARHGSFLVADCGASALSSMWPIALAIADGRSGTGYRPPALGRRPLRTKASSFLQGRKTYSCGPLPACSWTHRDVPLLTGQKGDGKSRRAGRAAADGSAPRKARDKNRQKKERIAVRRSALSSDLRRKKVDRERSQPAPEIVVSVPGPRSRWTVYLLPPDSCAPAR